MKIALITENSQAAKNSIIHEALTTVAIEQLAIDILQIELGSPAEALGIGHRDGVPIIDLAEQERIGRIDHQTTENAGHRIAGQHRAHARAAAGHHKIRSLRVEKDACQQARSRTWPSTSASRPTT